MSSDSYLLIQRLAECRFHPNSWDGRFVRGLAEKPSDYTLTDLQQYHLKRLAWKYRNQLAKKGVKVEVANA